MKIAITGGIGTGKTTVVRYLKDTLKDYLFYSVDEAVSEIYDDDRIKDFMRINGINNKKEMSDLAFKEPFVKNALERIANPIILEKIEKWLSMKNVVVEFPLLFERGDKSQFDLVVSVSAKTSVRVKRVMLRSGFSETKVRSIIAQQMDQKQRDEMADLIFDNSDDAGDLTDKVKVLVEKIRAKEAEKEKTSDILNKLRAAGREKRRVGIVSGSFDPITKGHLYVIEKALKIVDELRIVVAPSRSKGLGMFGLDERAKMIRGSLEEHLGPGVSIPIHIDLLTDRTMLIAHAQSKYASFIFRGLRGGIDMEYEQKINSVQKDFDTNIETIYIMPPDDKAKISSSLIRELNDLHGTESLLEKYCTRTVLEELQKKRTRVKMTENAH